MLIKTAIPVDISTGIAVISFAFFLGSTIYGVGDGNNISSSAPF